MCHSLMSLYINIKNMMVVGLKQSLKIQKKAIRIRISKKNRQHNGQKKKYKRTLNHQQTYI